MSHPSDVILEDEIDTRVRLYDFSTGKQTFFQWQAGMLPSMSDKQVLELGAGSGRLWQDLLPRWHGCDIQLTDIADNVLQSAKNNLAPVESLARNIEYQAVDFNNLPYGKESFDIVIANHNLYYATDVTAVLQSIESILKPGGMLICSTIGQDHLKELARMLRQKESDLPWGAERWADKFGLENGYELLMQQFKRVDQFEYDNNLHVNSIEPVMAYLKKTMKGALCEWITDHAIEVESALTNAMNQKGYIRLTPHSGFFMAYKSA